MNWLGEDEQEFWTRVCQFPLGGQALVGIIHWERTERWMTGESTGEVEEDGDSGRW